MKKALEGRAFGGDDLAKLIEGIALDVSRPREDSAAFVALEAALLGGIRDALAEVSSVDYLRPLANLAATQVGGLDVVTLNYDRTVETMAVEASVDLDTGIERWIPGIPLSFERKAGRINLYKLHGSVDWELVDDQPRARTVRPPKIRVSQSEQEGNEAGSSVPFRRSPGLPWIVVGDREKLATDGPTLDLLHAASDAFTNADSLVVVGYSFSDGHINAMVRNWMAADSGRTMTVVDPGWPALDSDEPRARFAAAYGGSDDWNSTTIVQPRIAAIAETASDALAKALTTIPGRPELYATADWAQDPTSGAVVIHLLGPSLKGASIGGGFTAQINVLATRELRDQVASAPLPRNSWRSAHVGTIHQGATVTVFLFGRPAVDPIELTLEGYDAIGRRLIRLHLPPIPSGSPITTGESPGTPPNV